MKRIDLVALLLCLAVGPASAFAQDEGDAGDSGDDAGGPTPEPKDDADDVDDWSFEGETKVEEKKPEEKKPVKKELPPEPKRNGVSGNWYIVDVDCPSCDTLLGQKLAIEEPLVMRQFFDFVQIGDDRKTGKLMLQSIDESRALGVVDKKPRVIVWQYTAENGSRLTDTYAIVWDLAVKAKDGLLYGRKYEVQAWTEDAYESTDKGYKAKTAFVPQDKLVSYADLAPVKALTLENNRFQVGDNARINFIGYSAFVRSDIDPAAIAGEQDALRQAQEAEKQRLADQKKYFSKGQELMDGKVWEEAITAFLKARELGLANLDLYYNLGYSYYKLGDYKKAKSEYESLLETDPRDTDVRYNLARIYEKEKDFDAAIKEYQAILKFNPDDGAARDRLEVVKAARDMLN